jgi:hypothetical protein
VTGDINSVTRARSRTVGEAGGRARVQAMGITYEGPTTLCSIVVLCLAASGPRARAKVAPFGGRGLRSVRGSTGGSKTHRFQYHPQLSGRADVAASALDVEGIPRSRGGEVRALAHPVAICAKVATWASEGAATRIVVGAPITGFFGQDRLLSACPARDTVGESRHALSASAGDRAAVLDCRSDRRPKASGRNYSSCRNLRCGTGGKRKGCACICISQVQYIKHEWGTLHTGIY